MIIRTNIQSLNSYNKIKRNKKSTASAFKKLSSGYKINSASDDAAGISISEKMRAQIRGLDQATANVQDGFSLVQTAEGSMQEITNMIQRQRELIIKGLNDTNADEDREKIDMEIRQLTEEIDALAKRTEFNKINLIARDDIQVLEDRSSYTVNTTTLGPYAPVISKSSEYGWFDASTPEATGTVISDQSTIKTNDSDSYESSFSPITSPDGRAGYNDYEKYENVHTETETNVTITRDFEKETDTDYKTLSIKHNSNNLTLMPKELLTSSIFGNAYPYSAIIEGQTISIDGNSYNLASNMTVSYSDDTTMVRKATIDGMDIEEQVKITNDNTYEVTYKITNNSGTANKSISFGTNIGAPKYNMSSPAGLAENTIASEAEIPNSGVLFKCSNSLMEQDISLMSSPANLKPNSLQYKDTNPPNQQYNIGFTWNADLNTGEDMVMGFAIANIQFKQEVYKTTSTTSQQVLSVTQTTTTDIKDIDFVPPYLHIQAGANSNQSINIPLFNINAEGLGVNVMGLLPPADPNTSLARADAALLKVSKYQSIYGAMQNRMEYAVNSLQTSAENISSSESRIRDADMAKEMMELTKINILDSASMAMLAQANQQPQMVLQLINGSHIG